MFVYIYVKVIWTVNLNVKIMFGGKSYKFWLQVQLESTLEAKSILIRNMPKLAPSNWYWLDMFFLCNYAMYISWIDDSYVSWF